MTQTNIRYAMWIMVVAAVYIFGVTFIPQSWRSVEGNEHAKTIIGFILGSAFTTFINYYWGSSKKDPIVPLNTDESKGVQSRTETVTTSIIENPVKSSNAQEPFIELFNQTSKKG